MRKVVLLGTLLVAWGASSAALQVYGQAKAMASDKAEIAALEKRYNDAFNAKDVNAIMARAMHQGGACLSSTAYLRANTRVGKPARRTRKHCSLLFRARFPTRFRNRASPQSDQPPTDTTSRLAISPGRMAPA
jgi:hypothetical protein